MHFWSCAKREKKAEHFANGKGPEPDKVTGRSGPF